jgi:hypothetical protein
LAHPNSDLHFLDESKAESFFVAAVDMWLLQFVRRTHVSASRKATPEWSVLGRFDWGWLPFLSALRDSVGCYGLFRHVFTPRAE